MRGTVRQNVTIFEEAQTLMFIACSGISLPAEIPEHARLTDTDMIQPTMRNLTPPFLQSSLHLITCRRPATERADHIRYGRRGAPKAEYS